MQSTRIFQDFGQQAVFEALVSRGVTQREARAAADKAPASTSAEWITLEKHIEQAAKQVRAGLDAKHTELLRKRRELENEIAGLESELAKVDEEISEHEERNLAELLESEPT